MPPPSPDDKGGGGSSGSCPQLDKLHKELQGLLRSIKAASQAHTAEVNFEAARVEYIANHLLVTTDTQKSKRKASGTDACKQNVEDMSLQRAVLQRMLGLEAEYQVRACAMSNQTSQDQIARRLADAQAAGMISAAEASDLSKRAKAVENLKARLRANGLTLKECQSIQGALNSEWQTLLAAEAAEAKSPAKPPEPPKAPQPGPQPKPPGTQQPPVLLPKP